MGSRALLMLIVLFHSAICAAKTYKCSDNYYGDEPINTDCEEINIDGNGLETTNASKIIRQQRGDVINLSNIPQPPQHTSIRTSSPQKVPMPFFINKANNYFEVGNEQDFSRFMSRWNTLDAPIKILHIGDSHVQSGIGPQVSSHVLQNERKAIIYRSKGLNGATLQEVEIGRAHV